MNKEQIIEKLNHINLEKNQYIVIGSASLVMQSITDKANDIDLATSKDYYEKIPWKIKEGAFHIEIKYYDCFEIGYNLFEESKIDCVDIDGYSCASLREILIVKKALNREKDQKMIQILERKVK